MADVGTVVITEEIFSTVKKIAFSWTSDAAGNASKTTEHVYSGAISRLVTKPGVGGVQPTNLYGAVVNDEDSIDALMGAGAGRSNVNTEQVLGTSLGFVANDRLSLSVTNAGNGKSGVVYVYIR